MNKTVAVYVHGKGGSAEEAAHGRALLSCDVVGFDYKAQTPPEADAEFPPFFAALRREFDEIVLIANSIGAYFSMRALPKGAVDRAFLISPIVNMEQLILRMLSWANASERDLRERGEIATDFGETLSWDYLCDVRAHPLAWAVPTQILYGEGDNLTPYDEIAAFAARIGSGLTVMPHGEHWFHTAAQLAFLDAWLTRLF